MQKCFQPVLTCVFFSCRKTSKFILHNKLVLSLIPYFSAYKSNRRISRPLIFGWKRVTFCHILHISRPTKLTCIHHKHSTFYWRNQQFFIQFYEERKLFKNSSRIYFTVNESTLNFCNLLFSSFKKWHFKLEINRGNSLNFNDNTMSVQNEHIARQARFLIKSLTTEIMWPSYKSRWIFCPLFWWPETRLIRREIRYMYRQSELFVLFSDIIMDCDVYAQCTVPRFCSNYNTSYIIHHFSGAPRGAFQQPVYNKYKVRWLRVLARPLQAVHNVFLSETLSCALS